MVLTSAPQRAPHKPVSRSSTPCGVLGRPQVHHRASPAASKPHAAAARMLARSRFEADGLLDGAGTPGDDDESTAAGASRAAPAPTKPVSTQKSWALKSVLKVFTVKADPNYGQPWQMCPQRSSSGSAFIVDVNQVEAVPNPGDGPVPLAANGSSSHSSSTDVDAASTPARAPTPAAAPATPSPSPGQGASSAPRLLILTNSHVVRGWPSLPS